MTNEQLAVLLKQFASHLTTALQQVDDELPGDVERHFDWKYIGEQNGAFDIRPVFSTPSKNPDDWIKVPEEAYILDPIRAVLDIALKVP